MYLDFNQFYLEYLISLSKSSLNETILSLDVLGRGRRGITPFFGLLSSSLCSLWMNVTESQVCQFTFRLWVMKCANVHKNLHATAHPLVCIFDQSEATWDGVTRQCDARVWRKRCCFGFSSELNEGSSSSNVWRFFLRIQFKIVLRKNHV